MPTFLNFVPPHMQTSPAVGNHVTEALNMGQNYCTLPISPNTSHDQVPCLTDHLHLFPVSPNWCHYLCFEFCVSHCLAFFISSCVVCHSLFHVHVLDVYLILCILSLFWLCFHSNKHQSAIVATSTTHFWQYEVSNMEDVCKIPKRHLKDGIIGIVYGHS